MNGDKNAFEILVKKHYQNIFSYCYMRTNDVNDAADLTQDVFLKLVSSIYKYRFTGKFTNYIFTIAVNVVNDYYRKKKPETEETDELSDGNSPDEVIIKHEEKLKLKDLIDDLPDKQREAIILYYFHDLKAKDIAKITGAPLPTVKSRIKQGMDRLRKLYQGED